MGVPVTTVKCVQKYDGYPYTLSPLPNYGEACYTLGRKIFVVTHGCYDSKHRSETLKKVSPLVWLQLLGKGGEGHGRWP